MFHQSSIPRDENSTNENGYSRGNNLNASEIRGKQYNPLRWFIPGILPEGLAILAGEEKAGKSFLALQWAIEASKYYKVAYIALEDSGRRIKDRLGNFCTSDTDSNLEFFFDMEGELDHDLIIIDTYSRASEDMPDSANRNRQETQFMSKYQRFAMDQQRCVLFLHHTRKKKSDNPFEMIAGTRGLVGPADSEYVLLREPKGNKARLEMRGRDLERNTLYLEFHNGIWKTYTPSIYDGLSPQQIEAIGLFREHEALDYKELAILMGSLENVKDRTKSANKIMCQLRNKGLIVKSEDHKYCLVEEG